MPIYEFVCGECGDEFEKIQSFSASTPVCISCGADNVERQMGKPAIHFKGSGWYINDSKKGGGKKGNNNPASAASEEGGEGEAGNAKSDDAPAGEKGDSTESKPAETSKEAAPSKESASTSVKAETA